MVKSYNPQVGSCCDVVRDLLKEAACSVDAGYFFAVCRTSSNRQPVVRQVRDACAFAMRERDLGYFLMKYHSDLLLLF